MPFVHLHCQSSFSPGWGVHTPDALCERAAALGLSHLALTDRNGLYGIPHFLEQARHHGLRPLIGAEAVTGQHRAVLLARTPEGYANLCQLLSDLHTQAGFSLPQKLRERRQGLTVLSDDPDLLAALATQNRRHLYVEISPGHAMEAALARARQLELPPVATARALLLEAADFPLHRVLRAIALNRTLSRLRPEETASPRDCLYSAEEMIALFPHCPQAVENSRKIAADCCTDWDFSTTVFPRFRDLDDGAAAQELRQRAHQGALRRYGRLTEGVRQRLHKELAIIEAKGFAHYFLVVEELARLSPRTCGRGSAAASLVAYCLQITHVDPIRHNLFFERFLNAERVDPPDIDIDFPWDERDAVLDAAFARYGSRRAAMVGAHIGFRGRAALREVAKVYGLPEADIGAMTERVSGYWKAEQTAGAVTSHPLFRDAPLSPEWQEILAVARRLQGLMRHLALHCGGLVIVPEEIRRHVPVERAAKGRPVIQWEKDQAEAAGLVKIDILGNRSLAVIRDAAAAIRAYGGSDLDPARWTPLDDAPTRQTLQRGDSIGCFYIESPATRQLLRKMWQGRADGRLSAEELFEHLVMASSIIRPAANRYIREFVARLHGKPWRCLHPLLESVLGETYGMAIYQEQITQMAMALADFTPFEGDQLRKIISKKHPGQKLADYRQKFFQGGKKKGLSPELLEQAWQEVLSFAGYSFCKPHSASYALVSCQSAWLKTHYPAEFMAAVISNQGGYYSPLAYLSEARRLGLRILPPDINASDRAYRGEGRELRIGLMQISGLSRGTLKGILVERERGGDFNSLSDFLRRVAVPVEDGRLLIKAGCFDALEGREARADLLWQLLRGRSQTPSAASGLLFAEEPRRQMARPALSADEMERQEVEVLGMPISRHPLSRYRTLLARHQTIAAADLPRWVGRHVSLAAWWVTGKVVQTAKGQPMEFISFEDTTAIFDTTFFPRAYARFCRLLSRQRPYLLKGKVEEEFGVCTLNVEWVGFLDEA